MSDLRIKDISHIADTRRRNDAFIIVRLYCPYGAMPFSFVARLPGVSVRLRCGRASGSRPGRDKLGKTGTSQMLVVIVGQKPRCRAGSGPQRFETSCLAAHDAWFYPLALGRRHAWASCDRTS